MFLRPPTRPTAWHSLWKVASVASSTETSWKTFTATNRSKAIWRARYTVAKPSRAHLVGTGQPGYPQLDVGLARHLVPLTPPAR
ncbi:MAG: hypothetical protein ACRDZ8_00680 [Acidimicrobiales bacterium]